MKKPFKDIQSALETVIDSSRKHASASQQGDYKVANRHYSQFVKALHFIRDQNAVAQLQPLMHHDDTSVRFVVSAFLLPFYEDDATEVLRSIAAESESYFGSHSRIILDQWKKGELKI